MEIRNAHERRMAHMQKLNDDFAIGQFFEDGTLTKFIVTDLDENFITILELKNDGEPSAKKKKRFLRSTFVGLIINKHFGKAAFGRRETYFDLREFEVNKFYNK